MYIKIYGIFEFIKNIHNLKKYNLIKVFSSIYGSTMLLVVYSLITRSIICYQTQRKGHHNIVDSQIATICGSIGFQFENDNRKYMLNK